MSANVVKIARLVLGAIFLVFGLNGAMMILTGKGFVPMPPPSAEMQAVFAGLVAAKYLMPLVKLIEIVAGALLLANKRIPLALTLLGPVIVNIIGLHIFVDPAGLPMAAGIGILTFILLKDNWSAFKSMVG